MKKFVAFVLLAGSFAVSQAVAKAADCGCTVCACKSACVCEGSCEACECK